MKCSYSNFKVLFIYPNVQMRTITPTGIAQLAGMLKDSDIEVEVFDVTRYEDIYTNPEEDYETSHEKYVRMDIHKDRVKNSNVLPFDWGDRNITLIRGNMYQDLRRKIEDFDPDLVAISIVENTFDIASKLLTIVPDGVPVIAGGVFATYAPEKVIRHKKINYLCRGEGEYPLLELCIALSEGNKTDNIPNIWTKDKSGDIVRNPIRAAIDINTLPIPDYSIFDDALFYSPMQGKVWRMVGLESQRGCPYTCAYCNSPSNNTTYLQESAGRFHRKKTVKRLKMELDNFISHYQPELIYFVADTFLAMSSKELDEFSEFYQDYKIPFWMNTRAETITEHSAAHLAKMNCLRFNIGIEHGNEEFVRNVLNRKVKNDKVVSAFHIAAEYASEYTCVANSIIGLPTETPELVFDTIEVNRRLPDEIVAAGAFIFVPFHGTPLRDLAIRKGYISPDLICSEGSNTSGSSMLHMPQFTAEQIDGFMKTFSFYVKYPKSRWREIDEARLNDEHGMEIFEKLRAEYADTYLNPIPTQKSFDREWKNKKS